VIVTKVVCIWLPKYHSYSFIGTFLGGFSNVYHSTHYQNHLIGHLVYYLPLGHSNSKSYLQSA